MDRKRLLRITTVPISLVTLLNGQLKFFQENNFDILAVSADGPEVQQLRTIGINHVAINMTRKITPIRDFIVLIRLIWLIRNFKPHIIHTHTPKAGLLGMMAAWFCRVPVRMHTIAGLPWINLNGGMRELLKIVERVTYSCSHKVYPNSINLKQFLHKEMGFSESKMKVIGFGSTNGIDPEHYKISPELLNQAKALRIKYSIPDHEIVFSFVGRVVKDKGINELVEAFVQLSASQSVWLLLVGNFEQDLDPISKLTLDVLKSNKRIILADYQTDVRPWIVTSDVFVFPSYREGFPNVVMQAACLERPIIASDINGCNEIISHQMTGLLVPAKNVEALCKAMTSMISNKQLRAGLVEKARGHVVKNFNNQFVRTELLKEYNDRLTASH